MTFSPTYSALLIALLLASAGRITFESAMQSYLGDRVDYRQRGLAIAISEFGWSWAFLLGIPFAAWLIARSGWVAPFPWLASLGLLAAGAIAVIVPLAPRPARASRSPVAGLRAVAHQRSALAGLAFGLMVTAAKEMINIVYGAWMEGGFGLQVAALGAATAVIGLAEMGGEGLVALVSDRLGKRRSVALGVRLNAGICLGLALLGRSLAGALAALVVFYVSLEFTVVSALPMMSEQVPQARATMMAGYLAAASAGGAIGDFAGPVLYSGGMRANSLAAAGVDFAALVLLLLLVREGNPAPEIPEPVRPRGG